MEILTKRCRVWIPSPSDANSMLDYVQRNKTHLTPWEPIKHANYFTAAFWQAELTLSQRAAQMGVAYKFVFSLQDSEQIIGVCNFTSIVRGAFQACYLGYSLDEAHQGQGIMTEVVDASIKAMFEEQNLHRIIAAYIPENHRSAAILSKVGFEKEGYAKSYLKINGQWRDHILMAKINTTDHH
ncbi:MAG: ribosomal protein S5-alanine N-acetyltransferase [Vibrio sp.]